MLQYVLRRLLILLPTLFFVSILIFGLQQLLPGDPALAMAGEDRDPQLISFLHQKYHLDEPLPVRYALWLGDVLRGDLGESIRTRIPVTELILQKLPVTIQLATAAILIALTIGIPAGIIAARRKGTATDYSVSAMALTGDVAVCDPQR